MEKNLDVNWDEFLEEISENNDFSEVVKSLTEAKANKNEDSLRRLLSSVRKINRRKYFQELKVLYAWMESFMKEYVPKATEWDRFCIEKGLNRDLNKVFNAIDKADYDETQESFDAAVVAIDSLDYDKYKYDIAKFNKRMNVLKSRLDRSVGMNFGTAIMSLRKQRGLSLSDLAKITGVSSSYINRVENSSRSAPSYPVMEQLAKGLNIDVISLLIIAGADIAKPGDARSVKDLIFSNDVYLSNKENILNIDKKQELVQILDFIDDMKWGENKHIESLKLFDLIDKFKDNGDESQSSESN